MEHWRVQVDMDGEMILAIESNSLSGLDLTPEREEVLRICADALGSFVGRDKVEKTKARLRKEPSVWVYVECPFCKTQNTVWLQKVGVTIERQYCISCNGYFEIELDWTIDVNYKTKKLSISEINPK